MKKALSFMLVLALVCSFMGLSASAQEKKVVATEYEYMDDGSYIVTVIEETPSLARVAGSKSGSCTSTYYNKSNVSQWSLTVQGTFTYTGTSSKCIDSSSYTIYHVSGCSLVSKTDYPSGNRAIANATVKTTLTMSMGATLSCSANGLFY